MADILLITLSEWKLETVIEHLIEVYYNKSSKYPSRKLYHFYKNSIARLRKKSLFSAKRNYFQSPFDYFPQDIEPISSSLGAAFEEDKEWPRYFCQPCYGLQSKWESFTAMRKAQNLIKERNNLEVISTLCDIKNKDLRDAAMFDYLSAIMPPTGVVKSKNKPFWKPSISDSQQFLLRVNSANDLQTSLENLSMQLKEYGLELQALVVLICNEGPCNLQIIGLFDDIKYSYTSVIEAVSNIFKLHYIFNVQYQKPCVWQFVQKYFFEIDSNNISACVNVTIPEFS